MLSLSLYLSLFLSLLFLFHPTRTVAAQTHKSSGHRIGSRLDIFHRAIGRVSGPLSTSDGCDTVRESLSPIDFQPIRTIHSEIGHVSKLDRELELAVTEIRARTTCATLRDREKEENRWNGRTTSRPIANLLSTRSVWTVERINMRAGATRVNLGIVFAFARSWRPFLVTAEINRLSRLVIGREESSFRSPYLIHHTRYFSTTFNRSRSTVTSGKVSGRKMIPSRGSFEDLSSARNSCRRTRRCEKRSYRGDETYERGPKFSKRWLSDGPLRNKGERVSVERVTCRQPYVSWRRERGESEKGYAAEPRQERDLEAATADNARHLHHLERGEERRDGVEGRGGEGSGGERKGRFGRDSGTVEASREENGNWLVARDKRREKRLLKGSLTRVCRKTIIRRRGANRSSRLGDVLRIVAKYRRYSLVGVSFFLRWAWRRYYADRMTISRLVASRRIVQNRVVTLSSTHALNNSSLTVFSVRLRGPTVMRSRQVGWFDEYVGRARSLENHFPRDPVARR